MTDDDTRGASRDHPRSQRPITVAVRVEAGWDRTATTAADINRISTAVDVDVDLRRAGADRAVQLRQAADVSVVDATVGQAAESATQPSSSRPPSTT